jgi:hypothetical protein
MRNTEMLHTEDYPSQGEMTHHSKPSRSVGPSTVGNRLRTHDGKNTVEGPSGQFSKFSDIKPGGVSRKKSHQNAVGYRKAD